GGFLSTVTNVDAGRPNDAILDFFLDLGAGMEFKLWPRFSFNAEVSFQSGQSQYMDGSPGTGLGGILGQNADTWATLDVGWVWYFSTGDSAMPANVMYAGIRDAEIPDPVDYDRIEQIVKDNVPREVIKEVVVPVEKESDASSRMSSDDNWVLVGLNYDFGSARLSQEAYPILFHAALVMLKNPDMKVEIQGHTDNIGSEKYNQKLSLDRAKAVKNYLIARGVDARRMQVVGYGSKFPIADNKTAVGRSMNRRIEFKTLN
ncbi:MAG: OmpA family protein, partial [Melioribacteraceae bacterium]|nr:OmpA family protein [Melioribacteraceae bacterium]